MRHPVLPALLVAALLAPAIGCARARAAGIPQDAESAVQQAALAAASDWLPARETLQVAATTLALFASDSAAAAWLAAPAPTLEHVPQALRVSYARANVHPRAVALPPTVGGHRVRLIDRSRSAPSPGNALWRLTRPGFSTGGDSAYVTLDRYCGPLCGGGEGMILVRDGDEWRVAARLWSVSY